MAKEKHSVIDDFRSELGATEMKETELFYNSAFRIKTPVDLLNVFMKGGFPSSTIIEVYGEPKAGKSTLTYMIAGEFMITDKNAIVYIIDSEKSIEINRMKSFGMDEKRVIVQPVDYIEDAFIKLDKFVNKVIEVNQNREKKDMMKAMVIWDTIAHTDTKARIENPGELNPGGMNEKVRIIKKELTAISTKLEKSSVSLWLINQVFTHFGRGFTYTDSGGGFGLKHGAHFKLEVELGKKNFGDDGEDFLSSTQVSYINVKKTKSSPELKGIPLVIDTRRGGVIDPEHSILLFFKDNKLIEERSKGWVGLPGVDRNFRFGDLIKMMKENTDMRQFYLDYFLYIVSKKSSYLRDIYFEKTLTDEELDLWFNEKTVQFKKFIESLK